MMMTGKNWYNIGMEEILTAISQVGFPISVAVYLLVRFEQKMDKLSTLNDQLKAEIVQLKNEIIQLKDDLSKRKRK